MNLTGDPLVCAYWWREEANWGDELAPLLLKRFADVDSVWRPPHDARVASVGSILEHIPPLWPGVILGSGQLYEGSHHNIHALAGKVLALRGPLTAQSVAGDYAIGDPGLLADELLDEVPCRTHDLAVVPHWSDHRLVLDPRYNDFDPLFIDAAEDPLSVIRRIGSCRKVVTSSLHGMIIADAFGIPRRFVWSPTMHREGDFKFRDYSESVGTPFEPGKLVQASRWHVEDRKHQLFDAYRELGRMVRRGLV
jgi:pyruvyltransferase